ncbi:tyrosine-type recombinase/integrase [Mycobacterium sp. TJFP1]
MAGRKGRRGWGRIRQLPNKSRRYQASYVWPPNTTARHNALTTFSTRALAEAWLAAERRLIERGEWSPPRDRVHREVVRAQTFGEYAERWVTERDIKDSSKRDYRRQLARFVNDDLGRVPLRSLDPATVRRWLAGLEATDHAKHKVYNLCHSIAATAVGDGLLSPNPFATSSVKKPARKVKPVILDVAEVASTVGAIAEERFRAPALIGLWCGLRWGELGELRRKDISVGAATITVARSFDHEGGCHIDTPKSGQGRTVVVPPHIRVDIMHHLDAFVDADPEALLLVGWSGCGHLSDRTFRDAWHNALKSVGSQQARLHDMRHFAGTMTARAGASLSENMSRLGHSSASASLIYQNIVAGRDEQVAVALSALAVPPPQGKPAGEQAA